MSLSSKFRVVGISIVCLMAVITTCLILLFYNQFNLNNAQQIRYQSYLLANELKQSSEDLTRLARTYTVTANLEYEKAYWHILDVRNGKAPRPDGKTIPLQKLMQQLGFTQEEFAKLKEAENNSNDLVTTETIAMNAIKGLYDDGAGNYTKKGEPDKKMAVRIMHDKKYHQDVNIIMTPIKEFEKLLDDRTKSVVERYKGIGNILIVLVGIMAAITTALVFLLITTIKKGMMQITDNLQTTTNSVVSTSVEMNSIGQQISEASTEQASSVEETSASLEEISKMVENNVQNSEVATKLSNEVKGAAEDSNHSMNRLISSMDEIIVSNDNIQELVKVIGEIGKKTAIIHKIVFQTKLLSFNASVEAERAGEHGRGFAVVAQEVGNLAQMSGKAAEEITEIVDVSQKKAEDIASENKKKVESGHTLVKDTAGILKEITSKSNDMNNNIKQVLEASQEQSRGIKQITIAMSEIDRGTQNNSQTSQQAAALGDALNQYSQHLNEQVMALSQFVGKTEGLQHSYTSSQAKAVGDSTRDQVMSGGMTQNMSPSFRQAPQAISAPKLASPHSMQQALPKNVTPITNIPKKPQGSVASQQSSDSKEQKWQNL